MIDHIVKHIVEEAHRRKGSDMVSNIYNVHNEIEHEIIKIMEALRECERTAERNEIEEKVKGDELRNNIFSA